jgi:molecular chaperone GrpE
MGEDQPESAEVVEPEVIPPEDESSDALEPAVSAADLGIELPDEPEQAIELLVNEVAQARGQRDEYLDSMQRVAADFDNFRKRVQRDQGEVISQATRRVVEAMLPTLDSFDAAATHEPQTEGEEKLLAGLMGTKQQLLEVLSQEGLNPVAAVGESFDPNVHEAISISGEGSAQVVESELRKGYRLGDRVLRPALVALAAADEEPRE